MYRKESKVMKKEYKKPTMEVIAQVIEPILYDTSIVQGEVISPVNPGDMLPSDAKGNPLDNWNGWDDWD